MAFSNGTFPSPADPFTQPVTLLMPDGTPFNVTMDDFAQMHFWGVDLGVLYGTEIGMSIVTLVAYAVLTQPSKRRSTIYVLNLLALIFNTIRAILLAVYVGGPWQNPYAYFADDWSRVPRLAYANSIAVPVMKFLELCCIEASLILQIHTVLAATSRVWRWFLVALSTLVGLVALGFVFAVMVMNAQAIMGLTSGYLFEPITSASNITTTISICLFFVIFTSKLGYALAQRRKLGLHKFGPMQVLFIMGLQTMIIPAIFSIIQYWAPIDDLYTMTLSLVTVFLPLSLLWAQASLEKNSSSSGAYAPAKHNPIGSYGSDSEKRKSTFNNTPKGSLRSSTFSAGMGNDTEAQRHNNINIFIGRP